MHTKYYSSWGYFLLILYFAILIFLEITISQEFVRNFFADIEGSVHFYAINNSLSVYLLLSTALMFAASLIAIVPSPERNTVFFIVPKYYFLDI